MGNTPRTKKDRHVASVAVGQHSVVTGAQLRKAGLTARQVEHRVDQGRLRAVHRGVYRIGGAEPSFEQRVMAACLASGGFASHTSAARLFGLRGFERVSAIHVTGDGDRRVRLPGVTCHRSKDLATTMIGVIPVTMPVQILLDVAATAPLRVEGALSDALVRKLVRLPAMVEFLADRGRSGRPGVVRLRRLVEAHVKGVRPTESWLEDRIAELLRAQGFPEPERQHPLLLPGRSRPIRFDFAYPWCRGAIEGDGRLWHASPAQQERDADRDRAAAGLGWQVERVTWLQLVESPAQVADRVRRLLHARPETNRVLWSPTPDCPGPVTTKREGRAREDSNPRPSD